MSNSCGIVFAQGLRQGDLEPLWDEMARGNGMDQCASEHLDPSSKFVEAGPEEASTYVL